MKKILIIMPSMFIGGAERSLLGLLEGIDYSEFDVSLFLYRHEGEFLQFIPKQVHLLSEMKEYRTFDTSIKSLFLNRQILFGCARLLSKVAIKIHCALSKEKHGVWMSMQYTSKFLQPLLPPIPGEYDLGIMFLGVADTLINKVNAKKKITWNHTDYDTLFPNKKMDLKTYSNVQAVVSVSELCTEKVLNMYPSLSSKALTIENCLAKSLIFEQAKESVEDMNYSGFKILSIGRFCSAKNFDNIPEICKWIVEAGMDVKWYLIGYGNGESLIRRKIVEYGMEDRVIILGKKTNPYAYISKCDLYAQPSRYEGKCVAVREAQILCKPVVITAYDTSSAQLENMVDGVIVPMDNKGCAEGIAKVIKDQSFRDKISSACSNRDYTGSEEIAKIIKFIED